MGMTEARSRSFNLRDDGSNSDVQLMRIFGQETFKNAPKTRRDSRMDLQLTSANEQTAELLKTTDHVLIQLNEAKRLRELNDPGLNLSEREWIDCIIKDTADAAHAIALILEPARIERETGNGKLGLGRQLRWLYRDKQRAQDKKNRLLLCYQSLMMVLNHLQRVTLPKKMTQAGFVHELGAEVPLMSTADLYIPQRSGSGISGVTDETKSSMSPASPNDELQDMLTWRRSKGVQVEPREKKKFTTHGV
ncbi:hypothetical protein N7491_008047 [Penicillium cf. griseofulvum]|uniref:Uncharacterized protein n=1 Tax=Penicillium cf. griseofulvum TaxID=2972120 RepID=A0A9W9J5A7_9EURO|nr:hypothetical protein N7472_008926 [Penicillium cf. griseofulvum]KAJ5427605.1 hypothetical protein N7491_008047 [Penicillium cf. griseofulvum]